MKRLMFAVVILCISGSAVANDMCDTLGELAQGVAENKRDAGVSKKEVLDQVNTPRPGGLSEENRKFTVSVVELVYARKDLTADQLKLLATKGCELSATQ